MNCRVITLSALVWIGAVGMADAENATLRLAVGAPGSWETTVTAVGQKAGIFAKHGIELDIVQARGSGETIQILASGSCDIGIGTGFSGVASAFAKGAPVRIIGSEATGATEFWYVKADSPIKNIDSPDVKTIAFSTAGSSTNIIAEEFVSVIGSKGELVATGGPEATLTAVMSGQIDVGWSSPPSALAQVEAGEIRVVAQGRDVPSGKNDTIRVISVSKKVLDARPDDIKRFMDAYRETIDYLYTDPKGAATFAEIVGVSVQIAERARDEFVPREVLSPDRKDGFAPAIKTAVKHGFLAQAFTEAQLAELVQIPASTSP